jgi:membrane protease YdiL (CAAX protease family)
MFSEASRPRTVVSSADDNQIAAALRGFGPVGIFAVIIILLAGNTAFLPIGAILALAWVHWSQTPWAEVGYARPASWTRSVLVGTAFGIAFKLFMKAVVMPLFGADPVNHAFHFLAGNRAALPGAVWSMIVVAGFGEETVYRGFLFERFGKLFGGGIRARAATLLLTTALFAAAHLLTQGLPGAEQALFTGTAFGLMVMLTGRIWTAMIAHAAFDLAAVAIIYWNLEAPIAHVFFR